MPPGGSANGGAVSYGGSTQGGSPSMGGNTSGANSGGNVSSGGSSANGGAGGAKGGAGGNPTSGGVLGNGGGLSKGGSSGAGGAGQSGSGGKASTGGSSSGGSNSGLCPDGITQTITVAKSGGDYATVQAAIDSIPSGSSTRVRIEIRAGTYNEKLTIASRTNLCLVGESATSTILSYGDSNASVGSTSGSASVHVSANDFSAANLTIQNSYGSGSQAVALRTTGQRQQFLNCRFVGYQDTLYTHNGSQYFKNCYVQGNTDYVFGGATAVLDNCEVRNVAGGSAVSAPSTDIALAYGIVFLGGSFTAASSVSANSVGLGRPWGANGSAAFLNVALGAHVIDEGFVPMSDNVPENARFKEYQNTGAGANASSRASYQMTAADAAKFTLTNIFGTWTPSYSR
jgi:pectin methylesterase-like acyl-CoA thioesterase